MIDYKKQITNFYVNNIAVEKIKANNYIVYTPFMDKHNDGIAIHIEEKEDGSIKIHDAGFTLLDAYYTRNKEFMEYINEICSVYKIEKHNGAFSVMATEENFAGKFYLFVHVIILISNYIYD